MKSGQVLNPLLAIGAGAMWGSDDDDKPVFENVKLCDLSVADFKA